MQSALIEGLLCSDVPFFFLVCGCLFLLSVILALLTTIMPRERLARDVEALTPENPLAFISPDIAKFRHSFQIKLPRCAVVMPIKGVHDQSYDNWRSQITSMYGGPLDFYFCIESADDPAHPHILRLIRENPEFRIHLMIAGVSWHCSQKIHNQMHGFERAMRSCEYVIVLDDDIKLHPGTIRAWVEELESDANCLAASGYAFEYVRKGETSVVPHFAMLWRMMASNGFNHPKDRPANVWGGAMMFRSEELRRNIYGLTDAWRDGGYSEDFITLTLARYHRRSLAVPKTALFPNELGSVQFDRFWNFMCRQIFVLTQTYASTSQRIISLGAAFFNASCHLFIFLGCTLSLLLTAYVAACLASRALGGDDGAAAAASPVSSRGSSSRAAAAAQAQAQAQAQAGPLASLGLGETCASGGAVASALAFWPLLLGFGLTAKRVLTSFTMLCNVLSPHGYGNEPIDASHVSVPRICLAYMLYAPLIPAAVQSHAHARTHAPRAHTPCRRPFALPPPPPPPHSLPPPPPPRSPPSALRALWQTITTLFSSHIVWAGVDFHITNGRVSAMFRKDGKGDKPVGEWYTVPAEKSLEKAMKELAQFRLENDGLLSGR